MKRAALILLVPVFGAALLAYFVATHEPPEVREFMSRFDKLRDNMTEAEADDILKPYRSHAWRVVTKLNSTSPVMARDSTLRKEYDGPELLVITLYFDDQGRLVRREHGQYFGGPVRMAPDVSRR